ncbi:MAG: hypothetical protein IAE99_10345 [Rhodothermales bacterium]|nr:hypothetical protein [Rhodothermales bacterium]
MALSFAAPPRVTVASDAPEAVRRAAAVLAPDAAVGTADGPTGGTLHLFLADGPLSARIAADGTGEVSAPTAAMLYAFAHLLANGELTADQAAALPGGLSLEPVFPFHRPLFDCALTQYQRTARGQTMSGAAEVYARSGFSHFEVNSLAQSLAFEPGVQTEYYDEFYTYAPGLSQFVDSTLTRGIYPHEYLAANLNRMKKLAAAGRAFGLKPGMCSFEPRTLPEQFFTRYPTLRGARVDHPFRSHIPRYVLAQDHPVAQDHYRQQVRNLMTAVPDLSYLSVWTNDSGAGFEHTASLYVGRNGGPFLIREWRSHEKIAEAAANSASRWLRLVHDAASETNPSFEVVLRMEPFKVEHDYFLEAMGDGVTFEAPSLLVRGYELPYTHPNYPAQSSIAGTIFHDNLDAEEAPKLAHYRNKGVNPKMTYSVSGGSNIEPLIGVPFPRQLRRKLDAMRNLGINAISAFGGLMHPEAAPYWPHPDVLRAANLNPDLPVDDVLHAAAARFVGEAHADDLVRLWDLTEDGVTWMPYVPLYSFFGFVWMRTWVRPLVPDIEAIPREDRLYYERFLVSTFNNPSINDLGRDVLFDLINQEQGASMTKGFDEEALPRIQKALDEANRLVDTTDGQAKAVFVDLRDRIRALKAWATVQRNTCAWVAAVHGTLALEDGQEAERAAFRADLDRMIDLDLENTRELLDLWETSKTEWMLVSDVSETSFIYGENFGDLLRRKLELTEQYRDRAPRIDRDILWRLEPKG